MLEYTLLKSSSAISMAEPYLPFFVGSASVSGLIAGGYYFGLYSFLYVILSSEDYALLLGSIAIFVFLALLMYLTRKINWYSFGSPKGEIQSS
ncbi:inner membrane CreD family protein [Leptospira santarosai]|uniref:inner membrane CreD family protein n=1 Tax=Leptospira santarosai TaxID=28183 RepID=UPI003D15FD8D